MASNDGGPAFPQIDTDAERMGGDGDSFSRTYSYGGMKLRDYFAGQMLAGLATIFQAGDDGDYPSYSEIAAFSYRMADAMIKARGND